MKVLFVDACVRKDSRTRELCRCYLDSRYSSDDEMNTVTVSGLNISPLNAELLRSRMKDVTAGDYSSPVFDYAKQFADADEIVIGAPYWDCSFPAALKIYLEQICVNGITFGYADNGGMRSLCHAKKMVYITTSGGFIPKASSLELYLKEMCALFSINELKFFSAQGLDIYGSDAEASMTQAKLSLTSDE